MPETNQSDMVEPAYRDVGERIAHARRLVGIRLRRDVLQPEFAKLAGFGQATINRWEKGDRRPGRRDLAKLVAFLRSQGVEGVTAVWIDYGEGPEPTVPPPGTEHLPAPPDHLPAVQRRGPRRA